MSLDRRLQLKVTYQDHITFKGKQLLSQMSIESKQRLLETVQARILLDGKTPENIELLNLLKEQVNAATK